MASSNDRFYQIKYLNMYMIVSQRDGYYNMTSIKLQDGTPIAEPRKLVEWRSSVFGQNLIREVEQTIRPAIYDYNGATPEYRGTYCHKLLVPHILCYYSSKFAIKVSIAFMHLSESMTPRRNDRQDIIDEIRSNSLLVVSELNSQVNRIIAEMRTNKFEIYRITITDLITEETHIHYTTSSRIDFERYSNIHFSYKVDCLFTCDSRRVIDKWLTMNIQLNNSNEIILSEDQNIDEIISALRNEYYRE
jgi:hypothetical protein